MIVTIKTGSASSHSSGTTQRRDTPMFKNSHALKRCAVGAAVAALATLTACGPGSAPSATSDAPTSVSTAVPTAKVTLKLYDGQGLSAVDDDLIAAFEKRFPTISIKPTYDPDNVTTQNQPRQLASATPP